MSSKGAITISHEDLIRMKMRANILLNGTTALTQPTQKIIESSISIWKVKNEPINGQTTLRTSKNEKKKRGSKSFRKRSSNEDASMRRRDASNKRRRKKS